MSTHLLAEKANKKPISQVLLLSCGIAGSLVFITTYLLFGFTTPHFDTLRNTISSLELVKNGWLQRANFILFGIFIIFFTIGLSKELIKSYNAILIIIFQFCVALGLIGDGIFVYEPMHTTCDIITFNSGLLVMLLFTWQFYKSSDWKGWIVYSIFSALLMMAFLAAFGIANKNHGLAGLYERLAVLPRSIWSILLISKLLQGRTLKKADIN